MANPHSYAAYKEVTPLGNGISEDMKYWNDDGYRRRREEADDAKEKERAKEKRLQANKDLFKDIYKDLKASPSGSKSYDEITGRALMQLESQYEDVFKVLSDDNRTKEDEFNARIKLQKLHNSPEKLDAMAKALAQRNSEYIQNYNNDSIFPEPEYEKLFQNGYEGFEIKYDDDLNPIIAYRDLDGDGILDFETFDEITGAKPSKFQFQKKYNLEEMAIAAAKGKDGALGYDDITKGSTYLTTQTKQIKEDAITRHAESVLVNGDGTASEVALSELRKRGLDVTKENVDKIKADFVQMIKDRSDYLEKENHEASALTSLLNNRENNKRKDEEKAPSIGEPVSPSQGNWGSIHKDIDTEKYNSVPVGNVVVPAIGEVSDLHVTNYTYGKDGKLILDGYTQEVKTVTIEEYDRMKKEAKGDKLRELLISTGDINGDRVTLNGPKKKVQIKVNEEDESAFSRELNRETMEQTRARAKKDPNAPTKKPTNTDIKLSEKSDAL